MEGRMRGTRGAESAKDLASRYTSNKLELYPREMITNVSLKEFGVFYMVVKFANVLINSRHYVMGG